MLSTINFALKKSAPNNTLTIRLCDIFISAIGLVFATPFILLIILLLKINSRGPAFFTQERLGLHKETFNLYKFRTMEIDAEKAGPQWSKEDDPRITSVGKWLRKARLDELPQLFNILKGDLSFVGPRPIRAHFADILQKSNADYDQRFLSKPGLTGWAQIYAPYGTNIKEQLEKLPYDLKYLDGLSIKNYFLILILTTKVVLLGEGI